MSAIQVIKQDAQGRETLRYSGEVISRGETWVCLRAVFTYGTQDLGCFVMEVGDVFTEWFYTDRWYNVFRVGDGRTGALKGWYCNLTRPAILTAEAVRADDLELDMLVEPDGTVHLLDVDDFERLALPDEERAAVWGAVASLRVLIAQRAAPFDEIAAG